MYKGMSCFTLLPKGQAYDKKWRTSYTLSYSLKYLRYLNIPLSISEFINKNITKPYNNALYIPIVNGLLGLPSKSSHCKAPTLQPLY